MDKIITTVEEMKNIGPLLEGIMDFAFDESCIMDKNGYIIHCSESSPLIWGRPNSESIGCHISELDSASPYPELLETGEPVLGKLHIINGMTCITHMIPLFDKNEEIIGAFGVIVFRGVEKLKQLMRDHSFDPEDTASRELYSQLSRAEARYSFSDFLGEDPKIVKVREMCKRFAWEDYPVLIRGETGCGKEILASGIHTERFQRAKQPFVRINCTAIPHELLESELFGYEKGAFSGAYTTKRGKFEIAGHGTILLDEIGDLDAAMQSKLLRVIEEREFERLGGNTIIPLRARILASTNSDLEQKMQAGEFREDLYYRLSVLEVTIPPLRERSGDIPLLIRHFLHQTGTQHCFTQEALELLKNYPWPGNVRQLRNLITKLAISVPKAPGYFQMKDVKQILSRWENISGPAPAPTAGQSQTLADKEREMIIAALKDAHYSISIAARNLGIHRNTLYYKIRKYSIHIQKDIQ